MLNLTFKQIFFRNVTAILLSKSALQTVCRSLMKKDYSCALSQKCSAPCRTLKSTYFLLHFLILHRNKQRPLVFVKELERSFA